MPCTSSVHALPTTPSGYSNHSETVLPTPVGLQCKTNIVYISLYRKLSQWTRVQVNAGRCVMQRSDGETAALTPEESWEAIQDTVDRVRSSMYVAGSSTILLLWGSDNIGGSSRPVPYPGARASVGGKQSVDLRTHLGSAVRGRNGGERHHREPSWQGGRGRRRSPQRRDQGVPVLACCPGSCVSGPPGGGHVELDGRRQHSTSRHRHSRAGVCPFRHHAQSADRGSRSGNSGGVLHPHLPCG